MTKTNKSLYLKSIMYSFVYIIGSYLFVIALLFILFSFYRNAVNHPVGAENVCFFICALLITIYCKKSALSTNIVKLKGSLFGVFVLGLPYLLFVMFILLFSLRYIYSTWLAGTSFLYNKLKSAMPSILVNILIIPFFEEALYRGLLLSKMKQLFRADIRKRNVVFMVIVSSFFFSIIHLQNLYNVSKQVNVAVQVPLAFLMGVLLAVLSLRTKTILPGMVLHSLWNLSADIANIIHENHPFINRTMLNTILIRNPSPTALIFHLLILVYAIIILMRMLNSKKHSISRFF